MGIVERGHEKFSAAVEDFCIGRNGQHRYNNMDHSMLTAMEAVDLVVKGEFGDKSSVWNVNTEKEYHEENSSKAENSEKA